MARKTLYGVAAVALVVGGILAIRGLPPSEEGAEGTIQAAKRDVTPQIQDADVVLQDPEIQSLVQTDFFHRMVTDKTFQKMVADGSLAALAERNVLSLAQLNRALVSPSFREALAKNDIARATQEFDKVLVSRSDLERAQIQELSKQLFERADVRDALAKNELSRVTQEFDKAILARNELSRAEMQQLLRSDVMRSLLERNDMEALALLARSDLARVTQHVGFVTLLRSDVFRADMAKGDIARYDLGRVSRD